MTWSSRCKKNLLLKELEKGVTLSIRCKTIFASGIAKSTASLSPLKCVGVFCGCNIFCVDFSLVIISSNCLSCPQDDLSSATLHLLRVDFGLILIFCELWKNCSDFFWFLNFDFCFSLELDSWSLIFTDSALWSFRSYSFWT